MAESATRLKRLVQVKARQEPPPAGLEERIRNSIAEDSLEEIATPANEASSGSYSRGRSWLAAAALIVVAVTLLVISNFPPVLVHAEIAERALGCHVSGGNPQRNLCDSLCDGPRLCREILGHDVYLPIFHGEEITLSTVAPLSIDGQPAAQLVYTMNDGSKFSLIVMHAPEIEMAEREESYALVVGDDRICCCKKPHNGYSVLCRMLEETYICLVVETEDPSVFYQEHLKKGFDHATSWIEEEKTKK